MRKFMVILFLLIININSYAINWSSYTTLYDCWDAYYNPENGDWSEEPLTMEICGSDFPELNFDDCCFTIVYYERWSDDSFLNNSQNGFDLQIVGIFYDDPDCANCDKRLVAEVFYKERLEELNSDGTLYNWLYHTPPFTYHIYLFTPTKCYDVNEDRCDFEPRCCVSIYVIEFDTNGDIISINQDPIFPDQIYPYYCPTGCEFLCHEYPFQYIGTIVCDDIPCNDGEWEDGEESTFLSGLGCPNCEITIYYKYREVPQSPECPEGYTDIELTNIETSGSCSGCSADLIDTWAYAIDYLLKYVTKDIDPNDCIINSRILTGSCWETYRGDDYKPCDNTKCCWAVYQVCNNNGRPYDYYLISTGASANYDNCYPTQPCQVLCGEFPNP
jgi:hypothetical protein